jgi:hypothetical protein
MDREVSEKLPSEQLIDRTFLMPLDDHGNQKRATIISVTEDSKVAILEVPSSTV